MGGPAAIRAASARVGTLEVGRGNDAVDQTYPERLAASMISAVRTSSLALASPTSRWSSQVPPHRDETDLEEDLPESRAVRGHDHVAPERDVAPGATAKPSTMAMTGLGS